MKRIVLAIITLVIAAAALGQESYVQLPPNSTGTKLRHRCNTIGADLVCAQGFFLEDGSGSGPLGLSSNPIYVNFAAGATTAITASSLPLPSGAATDRATAAAPFSMRLSDGAAFYDARSIRALTSSDVVDVSDRSGRALGSIANTGFNVNNSPTVKFSQTGTDNDVDVTSSALPTGAATETTLAGIKTGTDKIPSSPATDRSTAAAPFSMRLSDGAAFYKATTPSDTQPVSAVSLPLPSGASTETTLALIKAKTDNLDVLLSTRTKPADSQHVVIDTGSNAIGSITNTSFIANAGTNLNTSALALESGGHLATIDTSTSASKTDLDTIVTNTTGAATAANQTTGNSSLSTIASNTTGVATAANQTTGNTSLSAIATSDSAINGKLPTTINGAQPVIIMQTIVNSPPVLTAAQLGNPLLYRAAMRQYCALNLCPATTLGK